jgi:hypothetical protein
MELGMGLPGNPREKFPQGLKPNFPRPEEHS